MPPKAERIGEDWARLPGTRLCLDHVKVDRGVLLLQTGGMRDEAMLDREHGGHGLDGAGRGEAVSSESLGGGYRRPGGLKSWRIAPASARSFSGVEVP